MDPLPRKGRKPKPENEEEAEKQKEEKEQSKLRKRENYNAAWWANYNYTPKIYLGPVLGDAMRPTENKKIKLVGPSKSHNQRSHQREINRHHHL
jgi:hypothetical protein